MFILIRGVYVCISSTRFSWNFLKLHHHLLLSKTNGICYNWAYLGIFTNELSSCKNVMCIMIMDINNAKMKMLKMIIIILTNGGLKKE